MKVLVTTDTVGGVWTYALELADALAPHDVRVTLAAMGPPPRPDQEAEVGASAVERFESRDVALEWMEEPWADVARAGEWLLELAADVDADLVHLNGYAHAALPWDVPRLVVGHSCVLSWYGAVKGAPAPARWGRYAERVRAGLGAANLLVAPTRAFLAELETLYRPACARRVIPNGRRPLTARGEKERFVLCAGRLWDEAKNVAALDRVAPRLPWPVLVAGEGGTVGGGARLLGRLPRAELGGYVARASIYTAPARYEPFGLGALEAGLAGCALVLGDVPSLREVWADAALFVDPADDEALASALRLLIDDEALRHDLAERARRRAAEYTPERMAAAYLDAYRRLLGSHEVEAAA